jgi:hypothetical protein
MGCSQSALCAAAATLSQQEAPSQHQPQQQQGGGGLIKQRSVKLPAVRAFTPDPAQAAQSAADRQEAAAAAEALLAARRGVNYRDTYIRATLVSYGGSCRVFTAVNKHSQEQVAIKTITKVGAAVHRRTYF